MKDLPELVRALEKKDCALFVIGAIIGSGIFLTPSSIAKTTGDVEIFLLVWLTGGALSFCGALSYAELGASLPKAGGIYVYLREAYGPMTAFLYGWCVFLAILPGSIATLGSAFSIYARYLWPMSTMVAKSLAVAGILTLTLVNYLGVRSGARVQNILTVIKVSSLVGIATTLFLSEPRPLEGFLPVLGTETLPLSSWGLAMIAVLWSYDGWHHLTLVAGEVRNPQKNITFGLLIGTLVVVVLYLIVNLAYLRSLPLFLIGNSDQVAADAMEHSIGSIGGILVSLAILISVLGAMNANILGGPRVFFAMARDGIFFKRLGHVDPHYLVPTVAIVVSGLLACAMVFIGTFERLFSYVIFVSWIFYALGAAGVIVLRLKYPQMTRPYKVWGYPWIPILFVLAAIALILNAVVNDFRNSLWGVLVIASGFPAYLYWRSRNRSDVRHEQGERFK